MLKSILYLFPILWTKKRIIARREYFFKAMVEICCTAPDAGSEVMEQNQYDVWAERSTVTIDGENGVLIFSIPAEFYGINCRHTYSLWQIGDMLKIGVLLKDGLEQAPLVDIHREIGELWHETNVHVINKGSSTLYEWVFKVPNLYSSWAEQERFVHGMRHCKLRILRIIHDYALLKTE
jgi:hypothetical protein